MKKENTDFFEKLKRKKALIRQNRPPESVFFQLDFDETGAYLKVVDGKQKERDVSHDFYSGPTRDILKSIAAVKRRNSFRIDWELPGDRVYLSENGHLLRLLRQCDNVRDADFNPLGFAEDIGKIWIELNKNPKKEYFSADIALVHRGTFFKNPIFINESHVLSGKIVYEIHPLGEHVSDIQYFRTRVYPVHLEKFLSLFYSRFRNIAVRYQDYSIAEGNPKQTRPTLMIEKIDSDNSLYLRLATSLPGFDSDFFENYDISRIASVNEMDRQIVVRDVVHEEIYSCANEIGSFLKKHKKALKNTDYYAEDNLFILPEELAKAFIHKELPVLLSRYAIMGAEKLKEYKIRTVTPKLNLNLSHGIDFLEGDADLEIDGQIISLFDALSQYRKYSYISLNDGSNAIVNKEYMDRLERIFQKKQKKVKLSFFDLPIVEELIDENVAKKSFQRSREVFLGFNDLEKSKIPFPKLEADLRNYQKQGFKWLHYLHTHSLGGCLADDMGLGKTLQAIAMLSSVYPKEKKTSLIVMPKSLLFNWENEIRRFNPRLSFHTYHGPDRNLEEAAEYPIILTTYAMMRNDIEKLKELSFYYVILDESQNIKNLQSQTTRAAMLLQCDHRLALSGTPVENNLGELYTLFRFLNPSMFASVDDFNRYYATPIQKDDDKEALRELKKKIYPFILRRLKRDVLKDLPDKVEQVLYVEMSEEQKAFYEVRRRFYYDNIRNQIQESGIKKSQFFILQALSELRQIASVPESKSEQQIISPKREILISQISDVIANQHKVLVFANYLNALDCIAEDLENSGIDYLLMTGATKDRKSLVDKFQNDESYKVFLMTLRTGGIGLNLTAADYIFIFDPWWNRAAENQAIDRSHRIGQDKTVFSYKLICRGSIEEKILELQKRKSELFDNLISSDGASLKSLDEKDVEFILGEG